MKISDVARPGGRSQWTPSDDQNAFRPDQTSGARGANVAWRTNSKTGQASRSCTTSITREPDGLMVRLGPLSVTCSSGKEMNLPTSVQASPTPNSVAMLAHTPKTISVKRSRSADGKIAFEAKARTSPGRRGNAAPYSPGKRNCML